MAEQAPIGERALVLGGGGLSGIAWETGVLAGLAAGGADVAAADYVLGTSAGATVAAQLGSGLPLTELFERQTVPELQSAELSPDIARVVILAPMADPSLDGQVAGLTQAAADGSVQVQVLAPDDDSLAAMGINPLDPGVRAPVAHAGYAQGQRAAAGVATLWL